MHVSIDESHLSEIFLKFRAEPKFARYLIWAIREAMEQF
jgi:hypothetical protein